jgi:hypothetical protein
MVTWVHGSSGRRCELINLLLTAVKSAAGLFTGGVSIFNDDDEDEDKFISSFLLYHSPMAAE